MCLCVYVCLHVCMCVHRYDYVCLRVSMCLHMCSCECMCERVYICVSVCVCPCDTRTLVLQGDDIFNKTTTVNINPIGHNDWISLPPSDMVTMIAVMPFSYGQVSVQNN